MFYSFARACCMVLIRILFSVEVTGRENVPKGQGFMLVANHRSNFDPLFVAAGVKQQICFMAKAELFHNPLLGWLIKCLGAFPVERGKGDSGAIEWAEGIVQAGKVLGMFPEGTRSPDGKLLRAKSGAAMIAMQTHTDVLPCAVCYEGKLRFRMKLSIRYGKLLHFEELGFTPGANSPREIKEASRRMMEQIAGLMGKEVV